MYYVVTNDLKENKNTLYYLVYQLLQHKYSKELADMLLHTEKMTQAIFF